jgi:hypothetical protein
MGILKRQIECALAPLEKVVEGVALDAVRQPNAARELEPALSPPPS